MSVEKVSGDVRTSSPSDNPSSSTARYSAEEPELHITPRRLPNDSATRRSISRTCLPIRIAVAPSRSTEVTASISVSSWTLPAYSMRTRGLLRDSGRAQVVTLPPFSSIVWPVIQDASSETR